jgi:DNA-binding transcriptional regulator YiaG
VIPEGRFIVAARRVLKFSRAEFALEAGVSVGMLGDWETGKREPIHNNKQAVLRALEGRGIEFLREDGEIVGLRWPT